MNLLTRLTTITPGSTAYKGYTVTLNLVDGTELTGVLISVNSKGWNVRTMDAACVSRGLAKVTSVDVWDETDGADLDMDEDAEADMIAADPTSAGDFDFPSDDDTDADTIAEDTDPMDALVAELDGMTTAELADVFHTTAKELRVTLRALGMGVGKGRRYTLDTDAVRLVKAAYTTA
jgi:hypothetical protein